MTNWLVLGAAALGALTALLSLLSLVVTLRTKRDVQQVSLNVDGRLEELLTLTRASAKAEGVLEGTTDEALRGAATARQVIEDAKR